MMMQQFFFWFLFVSRLGEGWRGFGSVRAEGDRIGAEDAGPPAEPADGSVTTDDCRPGPAGATRSIEKGFEQLRANEIRSTGRTGSSLLEQDQRAS
jgi:hypothetical protein